MGKIALLTFLIGFVFVGIPMFFAGMIILEFLGGLGYLIIQVGKLSLFFLEKKA